MHCYAIWVDCIFFVLGVELQFMIICGANQLILFATKVHTYHCYLFVKQIISTDLAITVYKYFIYAISTNYYSALTMRHILQHSKFNWQGLRYAIVWLVETRLLTNFRNTSRINEVPFVCTQHFGWQISKGRSRNFKILHTIKFLKCWRKKVICFFQ